VAADRPRLLHRRSELGYTTSTSQAVHGEPEAVDEESQRQISVQARTRFAETRSDELARADSKRWCNRLKQAEMRARSLHKSAEIHKFQVEVRRNIVLMEETLEGAP
jgi:hypothetical protein